MTKYTLERLFMWTTVGVSISCVANAYKISSGPVIETVRNFVEKHRVIANKFFNKDELADTTDHYISHNISKNTNKILYVFWNPYVDHRN